MTTYRPSEGDINELRSTSSDEISTNFCRQLAEANALDLSHISAPEETVLLMIRIAAMNSPIDTINITNTRFSGELIQNIADVIVKSERIHTVDMSYTKHNQDTLISVLKTLASSNTIHALSLSNIYFQKTEEAVEVANVLATFPNLRSLDLTKSLMSVYQNITEIVVALTTSRSLEKLIIDYNPVHYDAQGLSKALATMPIQSLSMYGCDAARVDAAEIARNLTLSSSLRSVDMGLSSHEAVKVFAEHAARYFAAQREADSMSPHLPLPTELQEITQEYLASFPISYNLSHMRGFGHELVNQPNGEDPVPLCAKYENFPPQRAVEDAWEQQAQAEAAEPLQAAWKQAQAEAAGSSAANDLADLAGGSSSAATEAAHDERSPAAEADAEAPENAGNKPLEAAWEQAQAGVEQAQADAAGSPAAEAAHDERSPAAYEAAMPPQEPNYNYANLRGNTTEDLLGIAFFHDK